MQKNKNMYINIYIYIYIYIYIVGFYNIMLYVDMNFYHFGKNEIKENSIIDQCTILS